MSIDPFSQTAYYIDCKFKESSIANGTCFFVTGNRRDYLVTNWHNLSGKNPHTKEYLSRTAAAPNNLDVLIFKNQEKIERDILNVQIYDGDGNPLWLEHPRYKEAVDVVLLPVVIPAHLKIIPIMEMIEPHNEDTRVEVRNDVYILGYPFGVDSGFGLPIWKRASIASEPIIDIDDLPKMYVDTASRPGMSGAPVILKEKRIIGHGDPDKEGISWHHTKLVGTYSGRIGVDVELGAQLGIVWKANVIDEIIEADIR